jgi:tetrahydrodipicolinate N-succinyltransferase
MAVTRGTGLADFASGLGNVLVVDANNNRVGVNSASPSEALSVVGDANISGALTATAFVGDGSELTGVSGFATALSTDQTSPLNVFFKTPKQVNIGAGTSIQVESDATSGNVAFIRESIIHVAVGATFRVVSGTQLNTNVLSIF